METDAESIDRMLNLNVNAVIKNAHSVLPHMIKQGGGDIIVTSSLAGGQQSSMNLLHQNLPSPVSLRQRVGR